MANLALASMASEGSQKPQGTRLTLRLNGEDAERWQLLANKAKISLPEWIRRKCNGDSLSLTAAAEKRGMNAEWLADQILTIATDSETLPRDKLTAIKTLVAARGEETGAGSTTSVVNLKTPKALIIMGTDPGAVAKMIGKGA